MDIDRDKPQGDINEATRRVKFCLDQLEKQGFARNIGWNTAITKRLTMEEMVGALVSAEQHLETKDKMEKCKRVLGKIETKEEIAKAVNTPLHSETPEQRKMAWLRKAIRKEKNPDKRKALTRQLSELQNQIANP